MHRRKSFALLGATGGVVVALAALGSSAAGKPAASTAAAGIPVTVRIEGDTKTLLETTAVKPHAGLVKKAGHSCSATSAAGALQLGTRGRWSGKWYSGLGFEVFRIFGEGDIYSKTHTFWELFIDNVASSVGMCEAKLHRGDQVLFAAVPAKGTEYPLVLDVLTNPKAGKPFKVKVVYFKGHTATPVAGATVTAGGVSAEPIANGTVTAKTNSQGIATLTVQHAGLTAFGASKDRYVRAASVTKDVGQ